MESTQTPPGVDTESLRSPHGLIQSLHGLQADPWGSVNYSIHNHWPCVLANAPPPSQEPAVNSAPIRKRRRTGTLLASGTKPTRSKYQSILNLILC